GTVPDPIVLTAGERRTGVDAALATGASVSGTIRTAAGSAVVGGFVSLQSTSTGVTAQGRSGTDGTYLVSGLAAGSYTVKFTPPCALEGYAPQWYDGQASPSTATTLTLVAGQPRTGVDGVLPAEATISGTVRGAGGTGLGGA